MEAGQKSREDKGSSWLQQLLQFCTSHSVEGAEKWQINAEGLSVELLSLQTAVLDCHCAGTAYKLYCSHITENLLN